jgi:hypothetical protein
MLNSLTDSPYAVNDSTDLSSNSSQGMLSSLWNTFDINNLFVDTTTTADNDDYEMNSYSNASYQNPSQTSSIQNSIESNVIKTEFLILNFSAVIGNVDLCVRL